MVNQSFFQNVNFSLDIISAMPLEISTMIFRLLDDNAILATTRVCTSWYRINKSDPTLRRRVKRRAQNRKRKYDKYMAQFKARCSHQSKLKAKGSRKGKSEKVHRTSPKKFKTIRM